MAAERKKKTDAQLQKICLEGGEDKVKVTVLKCHPIIVERGICLSFFLFLRCRDDDGSEIKCPATLPGSITTTEVLQIYTHVSECRLPVEQYRI